jgi:rhamnosyl/mannosyltransferase
VNILQLSKFYPPVHGGIETTAYELTEGLNAIGMHTDVLCANEGRKRIVERMGTPPSYEVVRAASYAKLLSTSMSPGLAGELVRMRNRYDIVHVHLPNPMANVALWLARWPGRVVLHWHSDIINQARALKLYAPLQEWMLRRADAISVTSAAYADHSPWLRAHRAKTHVVPLGLDPRRIAQPPAALEAAIARLRARHGDRPLVFAIGRMASYKGFEYLIDAASRLHGQALVVIAGGGELLQAHRARVSAAGLEGRVELPGRIDEVDVFAYLSLARAFCLPSTNRAEAFGVVLLEAMSAGVPIVATHIPGSGVPWVNADGETGFNVAIGDSQALARALNILLDDPARARAMGTAGRQRFERYFTASRMVQQTSEIYAGL